ncbi:hypothetical protein BH11PAT2_BH11PAT2_04200 [soil metagenome]
MTPTHTNKGMVWGSVILGVVLLAIAVVYWTHTAGTLPHFFPGYVADATNTHFKHGLGALILSIGLFIFAWFKSAPKVYSV